MINFGNMPQRSGDWVWFKPLALSKGISIQYEEDDSIYFIFGYDGPEALSCVIWKGIVPPSVISSGYDQTQNDTDKSDFETNYKPTANQKISPARNGDGSQVTSDRRLILGQSTFVRQDDGSQAMNINGSSLGAIVNLWNAPGGAGDAGADWTAEGTGSVTGPSGFAAEGWDTGVTAVDDYTRFDNGTPLDVVGTYAEVKFQMQPKAYSAGATLRVSWRDGSNAKVGNTVKVEDYVTDMDLNVWQEVSIPIEDFGLTGNAQKLQFKYTVEAGQQFWFDDIKLVEIGGGPYRFRVKAPDANTRYHVSMLVLIIHGVSTGWNSDAFATVAGGLAKGLILRHRRLSDGEITFALDSKDNVDLFGRFHPQEDFMFADNVTVVGFMIKPGSASIVVTDDEVLEFVVRDDLSTINDMRAYVHYGIEVL